RHAHSAAGGTLAARTVRPRPSRTAEDRRLSQKAERYRERDHPHAGATGQLPSAGQPLRECPTRHSPWRSRNSERTWVRISDAPQPPLERWQVRPSSAANRTNVARREGVATLARRAEAQHGPPRRATGNQRPCQPWRKARQLHAHERRSSGANRLAPNETRR